MVVLKLFVPKYVFGYTKNTQVAQARALKWQKRKRKLTSRLPPDDESLELHCMRANYLAYTQIHHSLINHPSAIRHGWNMVNGKCHAVRYRIPTLPSNLLVEPVQALCNSDIDEDSDNESCNSKFDTDSDITSSESNLSDYQFD